MYFSFTPFAPIEVLTDGHFLVSTGEMPCHFPGGLPGVKKISAAVGIGFPLAVRSPFSLAAFQAFFIGFRFQKCNYDVSWGGFFVGEGMSIFGFSQLLKSLGSCLLPDMEFFSLFFK